ncbi:MAG: hypothetical protein CMJ26_00940 [Phycisphaerae bacterium]|jgi:hypothetical protein|nr:hypothetical protein [Phycisphaerae bacterium]|tara:strand:- start:2393 stop:2698 length:306 start_codon:yes stop_codon:yes gene_type:complete
MSKQFVIQSRTEEQGGQRTPLGTRDEIVQELAKFNTRAEVDGGTMLWGPGIRIELPPEENPVRQMLLHIVEEEIAWLPIVRLAKQFDWSVMDIETGRELQP